MTEGDRGINERLCALENRVQSIQHSIENLWERFNAIVEDAGQPCSFQSELPVGARMSKEEGKIADPIDRIFQGELFMRLAAVCFILVIALTIRVLTEKEIIPANIGAVSGVLYCSLLTLWSFIAKKPASPISLTIGVCGLVVLSLIVYETHKSFHSLSLSASFIIVLAGMISAIALSWRRSAPLVGWIGLLYAPIVIAVLTFPFLSHPMIFMVLFAAAGIALSARESLGLWPARTGLGILTCFFLFCWDRNLNVHFYKAAPETYLANGWIIAATAGFAVLFVLPSMAAAFSRRALSPFEKMAPAAAVSIAYYFIESEFRRWSIHDSRHAMAQMAISGIFLGMGVGFGVHNNEFKYGLRTFLFAGVILLLISSFSAFQISAPFIVLWSLGALSLLGLAFYFRSPDLRLFSYLLQLCVFAAALAHGILFAQEGNQAVPWLLSFYMAAAMLLHFLGSRATIGAHSPDAAGSGCSDAIAITLLLCAIASVFLMGRNTLCAASSNTRLIGCGQSIWLTALAAAALYAGIRFNSRRIMIAGFLTYAAAAANVAFFDLLTGLDAFVILSVFSFGALAGISSYHMRKAMRSRE
ncbi:MAG: hypothetical protein AB1656_07495 [Candidatus Omnitrophota bacterium]